MERILLRLFPRKVISHLMQKIGVEKVFTTSMEKIEREGVFKEIVRKFGAGICAGFGFQRVTLTQTGVRASPSLPSRSKDLVLLPPAFEAGEMLFKVYKPSTGKILTFYKL